MEIDASRSASPGSAADSVGSEVRSAVGSLYRRFRNEREDGALGDSALDVLLYLSKSSPQSLTSLSEKAGVAPASMSQSVNRLTSAGYAVRTSDPTDRRKVLLTTTLEGDRLAAESRAHRNAWLDTRLAELSPTQRKTISRACELLSAIADSRD